MQASGLQMERERERRGCHACSQTLPFAFHSWRISTLASRLLVLAYFHIVHCSGALNALIKMLQDIHESVSCGFYFSVVQFDAEHVHKF